MITNSLERISDPIGWYNAKLQTWVSANTGLTVIEFLKSTDMRIIHQRQVFAYCLFCRTNNQVVSSIMRWSKKNCYGNVGKMQRRLKNEKNRGRDETQKLIDEIVNYLENE